MKYLFCLRFLFPIFVFLLSCPAFAALEISRPNDKSLVGTIGLSINASDQILVSWAEYANGPGVTSETENASVFAQFVSIDGALSGSVFQLNSTQSAYNPRVFLNDDGSFIAAWESQPIGTKSQIKVRFFDTLGTPTGSETFVDADEDTFEFLEHIAVLSNGDFIVYWSESGNPNGPLFRRTFKNDGAPVAAREKIITTAVFPQSDFEQFSDSGYYAIAQEAFDSVSLFSTVPFSIADLMPFQLADAVATGIGDLSLSVNSANRLVAGWSQDSGVDSQFYLTIAQDDNLIAGQVLAVDEYLDSPSISISEAGGILIARAGIAPGTSGGEVNNAIVASLFNATGGVVKADFLLDEQEISSVGTTRAITDSAGNFIAAWTASAPTSNSRKEVIRLQKVDESGASLWNQDNSDESGGGSGGSGSIHPGLLIFMLNLFLVKLLLKCRSTASL